MNMQDLKVGASGELDDLALKMLLFALRAPTNKLSEIASWHAHVPFAYGLVNILKPRLIVELGVHKGDSYITFCQALKDHNVGGRAIGIDTWQGDPQAGFYDGDQILSVLKEKHDPDFATFSTLLRMTFDEALDEVGDGSVDLLHIDGLHTYEAVKHDFESWLPKLSRRGVVLLHDTAVRKDDFGVWKLWEEISADRECYDFSYGNGLGVLIVGEETEPAVRNFIRMLREDYHYAGLPIREILAKAGTSLESRTIGVALTAELKRSNEDRLAERATARALITKLQADLASERARHPVRAFRSSVRNAKSAFDLTKLASKIDAVKANLVTERQEVFNRLKATLAKGRQQAKAEADPLSNEFEKEEDITGVAELLSKRHELLARARDAASRTKRIARTGASRARHATRIFGRHAIERLPVSHDQKIRLKYAILSVAGPLFGVQRGFSAPLQSKKVGGTALGMPGKYMALAETARGPATNIPERSVSIVIPVYNNVKYTLACLDEIQKNTSDVDYEIIVVDDNSSDDTKSLLALRSDIIYLRNKSNLGFIGSCNAGAACARKTYLCFLNNDTKVMPSWLSALVDTFELHENVGLAGSKLVYPDGRLQEAGGLIWNDGSGWNWGRLKDPNDPAYNYARNADYCSGASILIPRELFSALGGFDSHYAPGYCEDSDLCFKIRSLGLATVYQPLSQVIHFEGVTGGTDTSQGAKKHQIVNAQKLAKRWKPVLEHQGESGVNVPDVCDRGVVGRILVLDQITPEPDRDAGSITALEIMRALRDLGYAVSFVPCSNLCHIAPYTDLLSVLGIRSILYPWTKSLKHHFETHGSSYDAVLIFRPHTWRDHIELIRKHAPQAKVIYHTSDLHFVREERERVVRAGGDAPSSIDDNSVVPEELKIIGTSDVAIVHSQFELELLNERVPGCNVVCFPWIYERRGEGLDFADRKDLIFVGGYRHSPNVDAVEFYCSAIDPLLKDKLPPDTKFIAAGSYPPPSVESLASASIEIPGYIEDITPELYKARIMVVPLRYGAGVKGKILCGMAHGLPIVTTSIGAEGLGLVDGEHVLIADTPEEFAEAVRKLYTSPELWKKVQKAALEFVDQTTSRSVGLKTVANILERANLPVLARDVSPCGASDGSETILQGSRRELSNLISLAQAARRADPASSDPVDLLIVPDDATVPDEMPDWITAVAKMSDLPSGLQAARNVIAIADTTDAKALKTLAGKLADGLPATASCVVIFAPPRLIGDAGGYRLVAPFSPRSVSQFDAPVHEKLSQIFAMSERDCTWRIDKSLTGYPSVAMLHVAKATVKTLR